MPNIISLTEIPYDRSRVVQDWKCGRGRYWNYDYAGRGLSPVSTNLALFMGITLHDALAYIASEAQKGLACDIDVLASTAFQQMYNNLSEGPEKPSDETVYFATEQASLVEGILRGFYKSVWPRLLAEYPKILFIEQEILYPHGKNLLFMSKPDLVLANDESMVYIEYKSTSSKKDAWINSWTTAVQLHSTVKAIAHAHNLNCDSVIVQGMYKGYESYGKQSSPFCYGYLRKGSPPFTKDQISYEYLQGFKRTPTWEQPGGVKAWVEAMPENVLVDQFPQTPPIYINDQLVEDFFRQREMREGEIAEGKALLEGLALNSDEYQEVLNRVFPQKFDQCIPSFGYECPYRKLCFGPASLDPFKNGFEWREPHHQPEIDYLTQKGLYTPCSPSNS